VVVISLIQFGANLLKGVSGSVNWTITAITAMRDETTE